MIVSKLKDQPECYEVSNGKRWWTVSVISPTELVIMNEQLRPVKPTTTLGKRIVHAVYRKLGHEKWQ